MSTRNVARRRARIVDGTMARAMSSIVPTVTVTPAMTGSTPARSGVTSMAIEWFPAAKASGTSSSTSSSCAAPASSGRYGRRQQDVAGVEADHPQPVPHRHGAVVLDPQAPASSGAGRRLDDGCERLDLHPITRASSVSP